MLASSITSMGTPCALPIDYQFSQCNLPPEIYCHRVDYTPHIHSLTNTMTKLNLPYLEEVSKQTRLIPQNMA